MLAPALGGRQLPRPEQLNIARRTRGRGRQTKAPPERGGAKWRHASWGAYRSFPRAFLSERPRSRNAPRPVSPSLKRGASGLVSMSEIRRRIAQTKAPPGGGAKLGLHACSGLPSLRREECVSKPTDSTPAPHGWLHAAQGEDAHTKKPRTSGAKSTMRGRRECKERQPQRYNTTVGCTAQPRHELVRTTSRPRSSKPTNC